MRTRAADTGNTISGMKFKTRREKREGRNGNAIHDNRQNKKKIIH